MNKVRFDQINKKWDEKQYQDYRNKLNTLYQTYRNHPILLKWLEKYPQTEEMLLEHMIAIEKMILDEEQARMYTTLEMTNGKTHYPSLDGDFEIIMLKYPFLKQEESKLTHKKNYIRYIPDNKLLLANVADIIKEENKETQAVITEVNKLYKQKKGVYLFGNMGVGKTYLMYAFLNLLIRNENKKVMAVRINELLTDFELRKRNIDEFQLLMEETIRAEILLLDDLGSEIVNDFTRDSVLFTILDERMRKEKLTYFTSNLDFQQLEHHYAHEKYNVIADDKAMRILERVKTLSNEIILTGKNRRY